jgi:hypothetical protein
MQLEAVIMRVWRSVPGCYDYANLEATMEKFGGRYQVSLEIHLEVAIE